MDKDKQARLEAKGWRFGDAEDFLGADTKQICEAIKELPERTRFAVSEVLYVDSDDLKALVAEVERLRAAANAVFDFLDANCDDREIVDQLREALAGTEKV